MDHSEQEDLQRVDRAMALLRDQPVGELPAGSLAAVRGMPRWFVAMAVLRGRAPALLAVVLAAGVLISGFRLSSPLPATLRSEGSTAQYDLTAGTTLLARMGETVEMSLAPKDAVVRLEGPGALVVRRAERGRWNEECRLELDLPSGSAWIRFGPTAPPHRLIVTTPQATIRITGTQVRIQATPLTTRVEVAEGTAEIYSVNTRGSQRLTAGQAAEVTAGWMKAGSTPSPFVWYEQEGSGS
ncbi:MAG: FecR domain-containing protein [Candidatus Omnitrophota bacterium]|nr:FecR domain-containing protein [Candidatus Omnitrophota bacterium]